MTKSLRILSAVEHEINNLSAHTLELEKDNAMLKQLVRIIAKNLNLDEDGNTVLLFTPEEVEMIKYFVNETSALN